MARLFLAMYVMQSERGHDAFGENPTNDNPINDNPTYKELLFVLFLFFAALCMATNCIVFCVWQHIAYFAWGEDNDNF